MAKNSAMPLLLLAGGAAVMMSKKKKKKSKSSAAKTPDAPEVPDWSAIDDPRVKMPEAGGESEKLVFNAECTEFAGKLNFDKHNEYITGVFHDMVENGVTDADAITLAMLKDQAPNCPWNNEPKWSDLMRGLYEQLNSAVSEYAAGFSEPSTAQPSR